MTVNKEQGQMWEDATVAYLNPLKYKLILEVKLCFINSLM